MADFAFQPGDIGAAENPTKVAEALGRFRCEPAVTSEDFEEGFGLLDGVFGPLGEIERYDVLRRWFDLGSVSPPEARVRAHYNMLLVRDSAGSLVAARDGFSAIDRDNGRVVCLLSHSYILPEQRRSGIGALLRAAPVVFARRDALVEGRPGGEIILVLEMEPVEPGRRETAVRLVAYGRAGFRVLDPTRVPYAQPDFRDVAALGVEAKPLPFLLLARVVGQESETAMSPEQVHAIFRHLHMIHGPAVGLAQLDRIRDVALPGVTLDGPDVPTLPLPARVGDIEAYRPLQRSRVLPLFPAAWHDGRPIDPPEEELRKLALEWT